MLKIKQYMTEFKNMPTYADTPQTSSLDQTATT
jgi:hypothetical protein